MSKRDCDKATTRHIEARFALEQAVAKTFPIGATVTVKHGYPDGKYKFKAEVCRVEHGYYAGHVLVKNVASGRSSRRHYSDLEVMK